MTMARTRCNCGGPVVTGEGYEVCTTCSDTRKAGAMTNEAKTGEWAIQESGGGWDGNEWSLVAPSGNRYALFERADAEAVLALQSALQKINRVRNRIVGYQSINWSRDIYPLVAALGEAGFEGMAYDDARVNAAAEVEQFKAGDLTYHDWPLAEPAAVTREPFEEAP